MQSSKTGAIMIPAIADSCACCSLSTGGEHELKCPLNLKNGIVAMSEEVLARDWLTPEEDNAWKNL